MSDSASAPASAPAASSADVTANAAGPTVNGDSSSSTTASATANTMNGNSDGNVDGNAEAGPSSPRPTQSQQQQNAGVDADNDVVMNGVASASSPSKGLMNGDDKEEEDEGPDVSQLFAARREEELARRDRSLAEFLVLLDGYKPLIPEEVTEYYLQRAGFECSDPRLKRLLSLSAQKFVSDLSRDAFHFAKLRVNGTQVGRGRPANAHDRNRVVLTMDDLSLALGEHGVNVKKPDYFVTKTVHLYFNFNGDTFYVTCNLPTG